MTLLTTHLSLMFKTVDVYLGYGILHLLAIEHLFDFSWVNFICLFPNFLVKFLFHHSLTVSA